MMEWMTMDSAPKKGIFLVFLEDKLGNSRVQVADYHPNMNIIGGVFSFDSPKPTHWMPLPEPPITQPEVMELETLRLELLELRDKWLREPGGSTDFSDGKAYGYEHAAHELDLFIMQNFYFPGAETP